VSDQIVSDLESFGATRAQLVDLAHETGPRLIPYLDLVRSKLAERAPVVFEVQGQPRAYVFDGRDRHEGVTRWVRRIAFRGDADWIGVLRPGRLDVFRAALGGEAPQQLDVLPQGPFLFPSLVHVRQPRDVLSVRVALLALLRRSISTAHTMGVEARDALSLVGRALFWRFLIDRELLDGFEPAQIAPRATSWESCLDNKANALKTFEWLDRTFNGGLLAFSSRTAPSHIKASVYETVVGNIAHAATADGQLQLRMPAEWREVNFSHVPVGLLSEVYEAFAHEEYAEQAKTQSVFYTPRHIADFVVDEALAAFDHVDRPRVLDPAAGAGVFLVTAFRALVAREWKRTGQQPPRAAIRRILNQQLTGFDINDDALRLSELALYLTAIELDPEVRPRPLSLLRFDELRERVLFLRDKDSHGSLGTVESRFRGKFDLVVGNPPWTAKATSQEKRAWVQSTRDCVRERLGPERAAEFDFPDTNPDLPFVYRAMEWSVPGGSIALVTHARWLFGQSPRALAARRDLLESVHVTGLLNGTALRDSSVWPNVRHPFCLLFAINEAPPKGATVQFISPELERTPDRMQDHLRIDWNDARDVSVAELIKRPWKLKALFRGSSFDESVIDDLQRKGVPLREYLALLGTKLCNGYQVGGDARPQKSAKHMAGLPDLKRTAPGFSVDIEALPRFSLPKLLHSRDRTIYRAPLLLVHESMRVDPKAPRAILALEDVAYDERFSGASFATVAEGTKLAEYLQLVIQSSVFTHVALFLDGQFGVEREVVHKETIERVPVVPWAQLSKPLRKKSVALSKRLRAGMTEDLLSEIDAFVEDTYGLSDVQRDAIAETLAVALPTAASKANATRATSTPEREAFARVCEEELADLLEDRMIVRPTGVGGDGPWRFVQVVRWRGTAAAREPVAIDPVRIVEAADEAAASLLTITLDESTVLVGQLDQYRYWTKTRARLLASVLVSEKLHG
jgi:N-6 DNA Methylase